MNSFTITCNCFLLNYILFLTFSFPYSTYPTSPSPIKRTTLLFVLSYYPLNPVFVQIYLTITFFLSLLLYLCSSHLNSLFSSFSTVQLYNYLFLYTSLSFSFTLLDCYIIFDVFKLLLYYSILPNDLYFVFILYQPIHYLAWTTFFN